MLVLSLPPQRHFSVFALSFPGVEALNTIYSSILSQHLSRDGFSSVLQKSCPTLVQLALALHQRVSSTFLPTAVKFHYIFNLRDLSNIFQVYNPISKGLFHLDIASIGTATSGSSFHHKMSKVTSKKLCAFFLTTPLFYFRQGNTYFTLILSSSAALLPQASVTNFSTKWLLI